MTETAFVEQRMREVNPVPSVDDINTGELARAVAAAATARATGAQAPTHHKQAELLRDTPRLPRRHRAWAFATAFVLILASIGIAALFLRGDRLPVADEPASNVTATIPDRATPTHPEAIALAHGWQRVAAVTGQPWIDEINGAAALPGGGFVAATALSPTVMWSPNGVDWLDGDPQNTIESRTVGIAVVDDQVVVLGMPDRETSPAVLWIGDPETGFWKKMTLDANGRGVQPGSVSMASNQEAVLIAAELRSLPGDGGTTNAASVPEIMLWLVDPEPRTSTQTALGIPAGREYPSPSLAWFDGRWLMMVEVEGPDDGHGEPAIMNSLWTSSDGTTWSEIEISPELRDHPGAALISGPLGLVATTYSPMTEDSDGIWFSANGVDWSLITESTTSNGGVYSEAFGFVLSSSHWLAHDGTVLGRFPLPQQDFFILAASNGALLGVDGWGAPDEQSLVDLWLYGGLGNE